MSCAQNGSEVKGVRPRFCSVFRISRPQEVRSRNCAGGSQIRLHGLSARRSTAKDKSFDRTGGREAERQDLQEFAGQCAGGPGGRKRLGSDLCVVAFAQFALKKTCPEILQVALAAVSNDGFLLTRIAEHLQQSRRKLTTYAVLQCFPTQQHQAGQSQLPPAPVPEWGIPWLASSSGVLGDIVLAAVSNSAVPLGHAFV